MRSDTRLRGDTEVTPFCINYVFANRPLLKSLILMSAYFFVRKCEGTAGHAQNQYSVHLMMNRVTEGLLERDSKITFATQQHTA